MDRKVANTFPFYNLPPEPRAISSVFGLVNWRFEVIVGNSRVIGNKIQSGRGPTRVCVCVCVYVRYMAI